MMKIDDGKWLRRFYTIAENVAGWSKDPSCKVGAVVVSPDGRQVSWGYNGFPKGVPDTQYSLETKELKNIFMIHAEANALMNCPSDVTGWALVVTKAPCMECAKHIIQRGIKVVVSPPIDATSRWAVDQEAAANLLAQAGVSTEYLG